MKDLDMWAMNWTRAKQTRKFIAALEKVWAQEGRWFDGRQRLSHALRAAYALPKESTGVLFHAFRVEILMQDFRIHFSPMQIGTIANHGDRQGHIKFHPRRFCRPARDH